MPACKKIVFFLLLCTCTLQIFPSSIEDGFKALSIYDYFKAKQLFYKIQKKKYSSLASYGLAIIYSRRDNPFTNFDSASKYISIAYNTRLSEKRGQKLSGFNADSASLLQLCDSIAIRALEKVNRQPGIRSLDFFLRSNYLASRAILKKAIYMRDELEFSEVLRVNKSDSTAVFIVTHPESEFLQEALLLKDREDFDEQTTGGKPSDYISFVKKNPSNVMINNALEKLYAIFRTTSDIEGLRYFVKNYPKAAQVNEAWKLLFSLSVKSFSNSELEKFLKEFPAFPFKNSILRELSLNKIELYPFQQDDFYGYVDSVGKIYIQPMYDAISEFSEGLAVANKNDSVFFINKENENPFSQVYSEAYPFKNGIAPVKKNNKWEFINRQGQGLGETYEDVAERSDEVYVVKKNGKYGALDAYAGVLIEPKLDKLGDFKNGFAYYVENGKYGFATKKGQIQKAEFNWISDFSEYGLAIVKQDHLYGIINSKGQKVIDPQYDLILRGPDNIFILVKNSLYGFYSGDACYLSPVAYDFLKEKTPEFYTNGKVLKLLKKSEQAVMDLNGKINIDFGVYEEINFASNGLLRLKKKNKYGFADRKLNVAIPFKYEKASDFVDSLAIVSLKGKTSVINTSGREIFSAEGSIEKLGKSYFLVENSQTDIIDRYGQIVFANVKNVQKADEVILVVRLNNNEIRLLRDQK